MARYLATTVLLCFLVRFEFAIGKIYERCELARELRDVHELPEDQLATWVCIAKHESQFDTTARNHGSGDHGIFQISQLYWCSPPGEGHACGLPCSALWDDDIEDDVICARRIFREHKRLTGDGFNAWVVYNQHCRDKRLVQKYIQGCFDGDDVKLNDVKKSKTGLSSINRKNTISVVNKAPNIYKSAHSKERLFNIIKSFEKSNKNSLDAPLYPNENYKKYENTLKLFNGINTQLQNTLIPKVHNQFSQSVNLFNSIGEIKTSANTEINTKNYENTVNLFNFVAAPKVINDFEQISKQNSESHTKIKNYSTTVDLFKQVIPNFDNKKIETSPKVLAKDYQETISVFNQFNKPVQLTISSKSVKEENTKENVTSVIDQHSNEIPPNEYHKSVLLFNNIITPSTLASIKDVKSDKASNVINRTSHVITTFSSKSEHSLLINSSLASPTTTNSIPAKDSPKFAFTFESRTNSNDIKVITPKSYVTTTQKSSKSTFNIKSSVTTPKPFSSTPYKGIKSTAQYKPDKNPTNLANIFNGLNSSSNFANNKLTQSHLKFNPSIINSTVKPFFYTTKPTTTSSFKFTNPTTITAKKLEEKPPINNQLFKLSTKQTSSSTYKTVKPFYNIPVENKKTTLEYKSTTATPRTAATTKSVFNFSKNTPAAIAKPTSVLTRTPTTKSPFTFKDFHTATTKPTTQSFNTKKSSKYTNNLFFSGENFSKLSSTTPKPSAFTRSTNKPSTLQLTTKFIFISFPTTTKRPVTTKSSFASKSLSTTKHSLTTKPLYNSPKTSKVDGYTSKNIQTTTVKSLFTKTTKTSNLLDKGFLKVFNYTSGNNHYRFARRSNGFSFSLIKTD